MTGRKVEEFKKAIESAERIVIAAHINPDGDTIGGALAFRIGLESLGKRVEVVCSDPVPANLRFLPGSEFVRMPETDESSVRSYDLAILVDLSLPDRLGKAQDLIASAQRLAIIDHHQPSDKTPPCIHLIRPDASASCLILYDLLPALDIVINSEIAQCLLTGIVTDTGAFRFRNTDSASLTAASRLLALGADLTIINEELWEKRELPAIRLLSVALSRLQLHADGRIAESYLLRSDYEETNAGDEHTEGIVNELGRVDTALISVLFREPKPGRIRVSLRSRGEIDVSEVSRQFGGGGHVNAAGCTFNSTIEEARADLLPALEACMESS